MTSTRKQPYHALITTNEPDLFMFQLITPDSHHAIAYHSLSIIEVPQPHPVSSFTVYTMSAIITIYGHNLAALAEAIGDQLCDTLTQFSHDEHEPPSHDFQPKIDRIKIVHHQPVPLFKRRHDD